MNFEETTQEGTSEVTESQTPETADSAKAEELLDLGTVERFKWNEREWTVKDLQNAVLRQDDYTKKTQALAQERKFAENFAADAKSVLSDPALFEKFSQIYPPKYVNALRDLVQDKLPQKNDSGTTTNQAIDPALAQRLSKVETFMTEYQEKTHEAAVASKLSEIDSVVKEFSPKYKFASEEAVLAQAQMLHDQGHELNKATWEKIFKAVHQSTEKRFQEHYKNQVEKQKTASLRGKDISSGGGIPGEAPKKLGLKDVAKTWEQDLRRSLN